MNILPELVSLFIELASNVHQSTPPQPIAAVSSLVASFNSDEVGDDPRVRALDAALSLMCFGEREIYRSRIECSARTVVSVLNSLVLCKVLKFGSGEEVLMVGCSMSPDELVEILWVCSDAIDNLRSQELSELSLLLLHSTFRTALSCLHLECSLQVNGGTYTEKKRAIAKLTNGLPKEICVDSHLLHLRSFSWYLDPVILKQDISEILHETIERPFLCLRKELLGRSAWRTMIMCLVGSPTIFTETRSLLHGWFLLTGLDVILLVQGAIVSCTLDILSRPNGWGIPTRLGMTYPFLHAYFSSEQYPLLSVLSGHVSRSSILDIVNYIRKTAASNANYLDPAPSNFSEDISIHEEEIAKTIDHNSTWGFLVSFPTWFYFASALVFYKRSYGDSFLSKVVSTAMEDEARENELHQATVEYVSWVLSPVNYGQRCQLAEIINNLALSWFMNTKVTANYNQCLQSDISHGNTVSNCRKLRIPKVANSQKPTTAGGNINLSGLLACLKEFHCDWTKLFSGTTISHGSTKGNPEHTASVKVQSLVNKIPLGILLIYPNLLEGNGCELLLHFATTGDILQLEDTLKKAKDSVDNEFIWCAGDKLQWATDGARLVFNLFDYINDIITSFSSEDIKVDYVTLMKNKVSRYLLKCVKTLLGLHTTGFPDDIHTQRLDKLSDLQWRLMKWVQQGRETFDWCSAFHEVLNELSRRLKVSAEHDKYGKAINAG